MSDVNDDRSSEKLLLRALVLSLALHLVAFSTWRVGQTQGWWRNLAMPRWMQLVTKALAPLVPKRPALDLSSQTQLAFVEVDPSLATPEPPKTPKFIGAKNTQAANKEIKVPSDNPNIQGRQEEYLKTTQYAKPTPPKPAPQPSPPPRPVEPQNTASTGAPKKTYLPGDLAMARPSDKPQEGKNDNDSARQSQPQPQPASQRPRTIAETLARSGTHGEPSRRVGGVNRIRAESSLDVKGTHVGDYLQQMVDAVDSRWHDLLRDRPYADSGKVVLQFQLHPDGRVSDVKMVRNEVSDLLETACEQAILDPSPYHPWPREMKDELGKFDPANHYDITFTFYYE